MRKRLIELDSEKLNPTLNMRLKSYLFEEKITLETGGKQLLESDGGILKYSSKKPRPSCLRMTPILVWIVILGVFSTVLLRSAIPVYLNVEDEKFLELKKCPACFGVMLCPAFLMGDIVPETWSRFKAAQLLNTKNVYFATFKNKHVSYKWCILLLCVQKFSNHFFNEAVINQGHYYKGKMTVFLMVMQVVLKKLGHDPKLEQLDQHILHQSVGLLKNPNQQISVSAAVRPYTQQNVWLDCVKDLEGNGSTLVHRLRVFYPSSQDISTNDLLGSAGHFKGSEMFVCPSQRKLNYIENEFVANNLGLYRLTCLYNLMTLLLLNSEPLVFQVSYNLFLIYYLIGFIDNSFLV